MHTARFDHFAGLLNPATAVDVAALTDLAAAHYAAVHLVDRTKSLAAIQLTANALWFVLFVVLTAIRLQYFAETDFVFVPVSF